MLTIGTPRNGTKLTVRLAARHARPCLVVDLDDPPAPVTVVRWLAAHTVRVLNVAGPRGSTHAGIHDRAAAYLARVITAARDGG